MRTAVPESFLVRKVMPCSGRCWPWVVLWVLGLCVISSVGCDRQEGPLPPEPAIGGDAGESPQIDHLVAARRLLKSLDYEKAADSVGKALLQNPNDGDTRFVVRLRLPGGILTLPSNWLRQSRSIPAWGNEQ